MTLKAVIFDYKSIFGGGATVQIRDLLLWLRQNGLLTCVFSTDPMDVAAAAQQGGYPAPDAYVNRADVPGGKNRGSPAWTDAAQARLNVERHEMLYIGCTALDWRTAINSAVFYLHAGWTGPQPPATTSITASEPRDVLIFASHYLMQAPRWSFRLDDVTRRVSLRCLLPAGAVLPSTSPAPTFKLQDVFTYSRDVRVGANSARDLLVLHTVSSLYVEGLLAKNAYFCVYPSSAQGKISEELEQYVRPAASLVHGYYKQNLLVRVVDAPDTSLARVRARNTGTSANISISTQASTVRVGETFRGKLAGRTVIVFDDFTTTGMSLEWARILLQAAGAAHVVLLTIGKYSTSYMGYEPRPPATIDPFQTSTLPPGGFSEHSQQLHVQVGNDALLADLFARSIRDEP